MLEIPGNHFVNTILYNSISWNILNKIEVFFVRKLSSEKTTACSFVVQFFIGSVSIFHYNKVEKSIKMGIKLKQCKNFAKRAILYTIFHCTKSKSRNECGNLMGFSLNFTALKEFAIEMRLKIKYFVEN